MTALHTVIAGPAGLELPSGPDDDLALLVGPTDEVVVDAAARLCDAAAGRPDLVAFMGDVEIDGRHHRRPGWSPTRARTDPAGVLPIAVRLGWARSHGRGLDLPAVLAALADTRADVGHLPAVLARTAPVSPWSAPPVPPGAGLVAGPRLGTHRWVRDRRPPISVVIPSAGFPLPDGDVALDRCVASLTPALGPDDEVVVVIGDEFTGPPPQPTDRLRVVQRPAGPFDFPTAANAGILAARSPLVLLLNDDTECLGHDSLDALAAHFSDPTVAAAGALLTYPDGTVQHAGVIIDDAHALHPFVGADPADLARHGADVAHDCIAVTGACVLLRRSAALAVGALSPRFPMSFNDIDLCLRLRRSGHRIVMEPHARFVHHESLSREPRIEPWEWDRWIARWGSVDDPWYHPGHHRPDDPLDLRRNADHLDPSEPVPASPARDTRIRPRVHHARVGAAPAQP